MITYDVWWKFLWWFKAWLTAREAPYIDETANLSRHFTIFHGVTAQK